MNEGMLCSLLGSFNTRGPGNGLVFDMPVGAAEGMQLVEQLATFEAELPGVCKASNLNTQLMR